MRKLALIAILTGILGLSGCGSEVEGNRSSAVFDCLRKSLELQGYEFAAANELEGEVDDLLWSTYLDLDVESIFRFGPDAKFVINYGRVALTAPHASFQLRCTGDFTFKTLATVEINGRVHGPERGEQWYFGKARSDADSSVLNVSSKGTGAGREDDSNPAVPGGEDSARKP